MKTQTIILLLLFLLTTTCSAQENEVSEAYKEKVIRALSEEMVEAYIYEDIAYAMQEHLSYQLKTGGFSNHSTYESFADALHSEAFAICKDKHLRIRTTRSRSATGARNGPVIESSILPGNIGYLQIHSFGDPVRGGELMDLAMKSLATVETLIIDIRDNTGGSPQFVQYACSYLFETGLLLNSLYWRQSDHTDDFYSTDVNGIKRTELPVYILTSDQTFSGAEEFAYNLQTRQRGIVIGDTTGGGAHPVNRIEIDKNIELILPIGRAINPVTGTNWEGTGVIPDIVCPPEKALELALKVVTK